MVASSSRPGTGALLAAWAVKSVVVMSTLIALRAFVDPLYSNPQCAARLVNESDPVRNSSRNLCVPRLPHNI
jgi:hypothetical protein